MTAAVATAATLVGPGATAGQASEGATRAVAVGASARWGWHKISHLPDGTRTFRTGYFVAGYADVVQGGKSWSEETIYAHTEDYTYRADDTFVTRVNRLFTGPRKDVTWTWSPDYLTFRVTGTMTETVCDTWYEVCSETGPVSFDVGFAATWEPEVYDNDTHHPTRWQGDITHIYWGAGTYQPAATGHIGSVALPVTYAASYSAYEALGKRNCRDDCEFYE